MGLFKKKKKEWDTVKSNENKNKMKILFNKAVKDHEGYKLLYAYNEDVKNMNYVIVRKITYTYKSIILGYRESDMSIVLVSTTPEFDDYAEPEVYTRDNVKKTKNAFGHVIYKKGGFMAGYVQFIVDDYYDNEEVFPYINQENEIEGWKNFWKEFGKNNKSTC